MRGLWGVRSGVSYWRFDAKSLMGSQVVDKEVDSVCPFCGVGCLLTYKVKDERIVAVDGRDGPANHKRLCVKGRVWF